MARGEVRYRLALETKAFTDGIKAAKQEAASLGNDLAGKLGKAGSVLSAMGPAGMVAAAGIGAATVAVGAVTAAVVSAAKAAADYADNLAALETKTGLSTDALQQMEIAAKLGNSSIESLAAATNKMQKGIVDGNENFKKLGLNLADLKRMTPEEQLKATAKAIESIQDPAQRTAAAIAIFGKSGTDVMGSLKALADGSSEMAGALDSKAIKASAAMADQLDLMGVAMDRAWRQFGAAVAGSPEVQAAIGDITQAFVDLAVWLQKHGPEIKAFFGILAEGAREGIRLVRDLVGWFGKMNPGLGALGTLAGMAGGDWYQDKLKDARQGSGVSSGGVKIMRKGKNGQMVPDGPNFTGAADDKAADEAAKQAARVQDAWEKAWIQIQRTRVQEQEKADARQVLSLKYEIDQAAARVKLREDEEAEREAAEDSRIALEDAKAEHVANRRKAEHEDYQMLLQDIQGLGSAFQDLGSIVGGVFGGILSGLGNITQGIGSAMASIRQMKTAGGGLGGMLGKASGALGLAGAAFSIGKTIFGGIKSFFGGKSDEEKAAEKQKIADTTAQLGDLQKKLDQMKFDKVVAGVSGVAALFRHAASSADLTQERMDRLGILGAAMFQDLKRQGLSTVEAMKQMGPALDEALKAAEKSGLTLGGTLGMLADFQQKVGANEGLVSAAEGLSSVMEALRATGSLTQDTFNALQGELGAVFADLTAKGFTADQALALLAPTLLQIRDAAKEGKIAVDEQTAALIRQAEAGGHFDGVKDPMKEMVELQKMMLELWAAIAQMQGVTLPDSLRAYIATLREASAAAAGVGVPGTAPVDAHQEGHSGPDGSTQSAGGFWNPSMPHGPLAGGGTNLVVHPGEEVSVTPRGRRGGGMGNVVLNVDGRAFARVQNNNTRKNRGGARSQGQRFIGSR
jgi:hypothetical protein